MSNNKVFHETYSSYLQQLKNIDLVERAELLGADAENDSLRIRFYNSSYIVSVKGVIASDGTEAPFAVKVVLCKYVLMAPIIQSEADEWVTYRDFRDASPLLSYFANNTNKTIETNFSGRIADLREKCTQLGGLVKQSGSHDLCFQFDALPRIPLLMNFNDRDEIFPAACSFLFRKDAADFLDMECLAITGTYLAGKMIS